MRVQVTGLGVSARSTRLLENVDLAADAGEWLCVIGPNGAGKSTLLRALAGVAPSEGSLRFGDHDGRELSRTERAKLISWVPQTPTIPAGVSVAEYVLLGRTPHLHPLASETDEDRAIIDRVLARLDLAALGDRFVDTLSGGELQRTVIARALAQEAPVMLLDEPTAALDLGHQQEVLTLLDELRADARRTIITTMHDLTLAGAFADRLVMLAEGRVVADGTAAEVLTSERIEHHYGARVRVDRTGDHVLVLPTL